MADQYNAFLQVEEVADLSDVGHGEMTLTQGDKLVKPVRLPNGLYAFKDGTGEHRCVLIASPHCKMVPTCCGSKPRSQMFSKSLAW